MELTLDEFKFHDAKIRRKNNNLEKELLYQKKIKHLIKF